MGHDEYPNTLQAEVDVMRQMNNKRSNIVKKNKYDNCNQNSNHENENTRNDSSFTKTSKRRCFCYGSKDHMLYTCPTKDDVEKNKCFQWNNKDITHLHTTKDEGNYGNNDASLASDADMSVVSDSSGTSAEKSGWSGI